MKQNLKFNKESDLWYIDIPDWTGTKAELRMVAGADLLLDVLDKDKDNSVSLTIDTEDFKGSNIKLTKLLNCFGGATYITKSKDFNKPVWLCAVTKYVFDGKLPKKLYVKT
tara:strand:+ start:7872 stop:8204 length:333 start_codon:yes stop_codon:yes gene_type:complete